MEYYWVMMTLVSAFTLATSDAFSKKALDGSNEYLVAGARLIFSLPIFIVMLFFVPVPHLDKEFYTAYMIALPVELITVVLYIKALKESPLSLTLPYQALTPVFLIFFSYVLLGEKVSLAGGIGIFLVAAGGYLLNFNRMKDGLLAPFRAVMREKGAVYMIIVALLYGITSSMGKRAIEHSSPLFFGATYFIGLNLAYLPIGYIKGKKDIRNYIVSGNYKRMLLPGLLTSVMVLTHMIAMSLTQVAYMVSVKRSSLLMSIAYGHFMFREDNIRKRFLGASLMFVGFVLVVLAG